MRRTALSSCLLAALVWLGSSYSYAQVTEVTDEAFIRAALVVTTFDQFAANCQRSRGLSASQAAQVAKWQADNGVDRIRARLPELARHPSQQQQVEKGAAEVASKISAQKINDCAAAVSVTRLPDAQFAKLAPQLLAAPKPAADPAPSTPTAQPASPAGPTKLTSRATAELLAQIDSFGFASRTIMGVGGFLTVDIYPVVLFRSGDALTDVEGLLFPGGPEAHKRANPKSWTRWRRNGGKLELEGRKGWEALPFQTTYARLPDGLKLEGLFRHLGGSGTVATGGSDSVAAYREYRFTSDGRVVRGGGAGGRAETGGGSVVSRSEAPNRRGQYRIDGLMLHISYDDGSSEERILITDPKNPSKAIWLDGVGYVRRNK